MIKKALQHRTGERAEHAWELHRIAHEHIYVEEAEKVGKVIEYCDQICSMATAIKVAARNELEVQTALANAATLERVCAVERRLNFGKENHGTQPGFSWTDHSGHLIITELR